MSKTDEFSHGTDHRFSVSKDGTSYKTCCGSKIEKVFLNGKPHWNVLAPGRESHNPNATYRTLREAKGSLEDTHKG